MSDKFRLGDFRISNEKRSTDSRIVKNEENQVKNIEKFELPKLIEKGKGDYSNIKSKFGSLATTDQDWSERQQKDRRFSLSHLVSSHLAVDEEERRALEARVNLEVARLSEQAKADAAKAGYEDGLKRGHDEAYQKFLDEGKSKIARLEALVGELEGAKEDIFRTNERFLVDLIFKVSKMVLLKELSADKDYLLRLVRELIERVGVRENVTIKINPEELGSIGMLKEGLEKTFGALKNVNIEVSNQVKLGGCMLETEWNAIDASVETQLKGLYEGLLGNQSTGAST